MSREIKFRAYWNGHTPRMFYEIGEGTEENKGVNATVRAYIEDKNWTVEQFAGFQDWNGKDVYEGDVLRLKNSADPDTGEDPFTLGSLMWMNGQFLFVEKDGNSLTPDEYMLTGAFDGEVIGTIHENPDLLS